MQSDEVARLCLERYRDLGSCSAKPHVRADGKLEWTVLAGVVLSLPRERTSLESDTHEAQVRKDAASSDMQALCISLGTGVKALPHNVLPVHGDVLHDCHAEVLARRAARRWLLSRLVREAASQTRTQAQAATVDGLPFVFVQRSDEARNQPWRVREDVTFHLYCSTMPCGDASSHMIMQQQGQHLSLDSDLSWGHLPRNAAVLRGRAHSSAQSLHLRTKPGRTQAEASLSMSCTDKIAAWSVSGFQGALLYRWIGRVWFDSIVVGDEALRCADQSASSILDATSAAEHARNVITQKCTHPAVDAANVRVPVIQLSSRSFADSREQVQRRFDMQDLDGSGRTEDGQWVVPSSASLTWSQGTKAQGIIEGRRQGASARRVPGQALKKTSRSDLSKLDWFQAVSEAAALLESGDFASTARSTYHEAKHKDFAQAYQTLKQKMRGTCRLTSSEKQSLEREQIAAFLQSDSSRCQQEQGLVSTSIISACGVEEAIIDDAAPFRGWLVAGARWESFSADGSVNNAAY